MWHVVSAKPGASLLLGLKAGVTREKLLEALQNHTLEDLLERHPVHAGDTFFVPARTPHTIGTDMVICEVQEYSDLTYRVYDYGRVDAHGKPRELHVDKALAVMDFDPPHGGKVTPRSWIKGRENRGLNHLVKCSYFSVDRLDVDRIRTAAGINDAAFQQQRVAAGLKADKVIRARLVAHGRANDPGSSVCRGNRYSRNQRSRRIGNRLQQAPRSHSHGP